MNPRGLRPASTGTLKARVRSPTAFSSSAGRAVGLQSARVPCRGMKPIPHTQRNTGHELMDEAHPDPARLGNEFRFLVKFNAATGSGTAIVDALRSRMSPTSGQQVSVVDFGAGVGDIARSFITRAARRGWVAHCLATDRNPLVLDMARARGTMDGLSFAAVDVRQAKAILGAKSFDAAHASLMLHHLPDHEVVEALKVMSAVARHAVIWNDLIHDAFGIAGAWFATLTSPAETKRDAMLSVKNGFSKRQAVEFAEAAGLRDIRVRRWRGPRFLLTARPAD